MCIMHKFLGIMIKGAHHKVPINQGAALRKGEPEAFICKLSVAKSHSEFMP